MFSLSSLVCTPSRGVIFRVKVPNGGWRTPTVSQEQEGVLGKENR
ncbi:hypothetical protein GCM10023310_52020 [Paenibacillus vulneris]